MGMIETAEAEYEDLTKKRQVSFHYCSAEYFLNFILL